MASRSTSNRCSIDPSTLIALLDPDDEELAFVFSRQDLRPISIYRIQFAEYLVCYNGK